jgi:nucleoside-diphosphate-sugar epimerase
MSGDPVASAPLSGDWQRSYAGKTVAVSGAGGFVGGCLVKRLAELPCNVVRVARPAAWESVAGEADVVFHFAAQTSIKVAAENPDWDFDSNVAPMRALLDACERTRSRPVVVFAGTVTQAGIPARVPVNEDVIDDPLTVYDRHKLIAENHLKAAASRGIVSGTTLRLSNVYGPGAAGGNRDRHVLNRMIAAALRGEPLTVYGPGDYLRDYLFIEDVADAFLIAAAHHAALNGRHFVVGSGTGTTIRGAFELIAARVAALTGRRVPVLLTEPPSALSPIDQRHFVADPSRFAAATGWRAAWSLSDGIDRSIEAALCA